MLFFMGYGFMKQLTMESSRFQLFVRQALILALSVHTLFLMLFVALNIPMLIMAHIASVVLYILAIRLSRSSAFKTIAALIWIDLFGHALISSEVLGWQSGFHLYLLLLIPITFLYDVKPQSRRILLVEVSVVLYLLLDYHLYDQAAMVELPPIYAMLIRYLNAIVCFAGLSYQLHFYATYWQDRGYQSVDKSDTDKLTGLHNREAILSKIDEIFSSSSLTRQHMSLIIADIDYFKMINEQYGHNIGDAALVYVAQILHDSIRQNDRASRWGGGEFLLLLPGGPLKSAEQIAERVQNKLRSLPLHKNGKTISISMTFGIAELLPGEDFNQCLIRADMALRHGKEHGRNRIELAASDIPVTTPV
jgi:diguanylate cyclase (GGDEF)-like protein